MSSSNSAKQGTQTFLIECNRGNSIIDANAPESNNGKWTTKTDFQFKRGDRVGVEAIMIESTGAGSQQQTIEFSGENIKQGEIIQNWTDDVVVLEFGFYVKNNAEKTINLPVEFYHNLNNDYGINLRINQGTWIKPADLVAGTPAATAYKYQFPGVAPIAGINTPNYDNGAFNFKQAAAGSNGTAYDVFAFRDENNVVIPFNAVPVLQVKKIILSKSTDPNPNANILTDMGELEIPFPNGYLKSGMNTPFSQGLNVAIKNAAGDISVMSNEFIDHLEPDYNIVANVPVYTGRVAIILESATDSIQISSAANMQIIPTKPFLQEPDGTIRKMWWGTSSNPVQQMPPATNAVYEPGARMGIGLYNGSAPYQAAVPAAGSSTGLRSDAMNINGGAGLWEQTRVWSAVDATQVPALGSSTATTPAANGARNLKTLDLRNYKDNRPYILVSPEYQAPQPTPNGLSLCPKLQPMTAYVIVRADSSFEDVNNLAQKFTEAFHAINPLVLGQGKDLQKYLDDQEFPFNNMNNSLPLTSTGYYSKEEATGAGGLSVDYTNSTAALFNRVEPLWIGNLVKCIPANLTTSPDWKKQAGSPYYYNPNDDDDYLKVGIKGDWNWNNLIYGNMGLVNFNKCWSGDRFIRLKCWDGNTTTHPHRDIPRPVVLNTQLRLLEASQPAPPTSPNPFTFLGAEMLTYEPIFTNIEYTDENLDIIQECFRHSEKYIVERRAYLDNRVIDDYAGQQASPYWEYEMDIGMSRGDIAMNENTSPDGLMTKVETNWLSEYPASAAAGTPNPAYSTDSKITPSQSFPGNGGEIELQQARDTGRVQVFSRYQDGWETGTGINNSPRTTLENPGLSIIGSNNAFCIIQHVAGSTTPIKSELYYKSKERNIGALPYVYNDENGVQRTLTMFLVSKIYQPETARNFSDTTSGRSTWELAFFGWGEFFGFSPQFGYDQPAVLPVNPDNIANQVKIAEPPTAPVLVNEEWLIDDVSGNDPLSPISMSNTYSFTTPNPTFAAPIPLTNGVMKFYDSGGSASNYSDGELRAITFDAGVDANGNPHHFWIKLNSYFMEASATTHYDRLGICAADTIADLANQSSVLSNTTAPILSPILYQSTANTPETAWGTSYVATNGGFGTGGGWIIPSEYPTDSQGNTHALMNTWLEVKTRYIRFYFKSDTSVNRFGWDFDLIRGLYTPTFQSGGALTTLDPALKWRWNNQNFLWVGANDAAMVFDNTNNRFTLSQLYTEKLLSAVDAKTGTIPANQTQLGEVYAGMNTDYAGTQDSFKPTTTKVPKHYKTTNQGVEDAVCGVYLNNVYFAPKGWSPPTNINPKNLYSPGSNSYYYTEPHLNPQVQQPTYPIATYSNTTTENREAFLAPLTKATPENWTGNLLDKMGFDYDQIIPPYGGQDNRYSAFTYGRTDIATMYNGTKPLMLNAETDVAADLDLNVFTYNAATNAAGLSTLDGTPLYTNGLLNNNPINLGNMVSAKLIANRIPTLFACPFYLVISDICPTQFQSGSMKQDCIFYGLKNYGAGQYFYVFGSNYSQLVDTDRTITQVNTEIRNPLTGRLARLSKNSCIIYKVERDIALPAVEVDIQGQPIAQATPQTQDQDEMAGVYNELKKLVNIQSGEKAELSTLVKEDTGSHDTLTNIAKLMKRLNSNSKNAVGIHHNMDFGGAIRNPDDPLRLTREEAERIVRDEIELEEAQGGMEMKQGDKEQSMRARVDELMKAQEKGGRGEIDAKDLYEDLAKIIVNKALAALPITMGTREGTIGNPAVIATAIRNSLREFNPLLEQMARDIEAGEASLDDAIGALQEKDLYLSARGRVIGKKEEKGRKPRAAGLKGQADAMYLALPDFADAIAGSWLNDNGANIEEIVRSGIDLEELGIVQGEEADFAPMTLDEIRKNREETIEKMKQYKSSKYLEGKARRAGATDDMMLEGRFLMEQEARQQAEQEVSNMGKGMSKEEMKKAYDEAYKTYKAKEEKDFSKDPLAYIRMFGRAGEGVAPNKVFELQERHRLDEGAVSSAGGKAKAQEEVAEGKGE